MKSASLLSCAFLLVALVAGTSSSGSLAQPASQAAAASQASPEGSNQLDKRATLPDTGSASAPAAAKPGQSSHGIGIVDNGAPDKALWVKGRKNENPDRIEMALGDFVILKLDGPLEKALRDEKPGNKLGLYMNDLYFKDLPPLPVPDRSNAVMFQLKRTDTNREAWSVLFAKKEFSFASMGPACSIDSNDGVYMTVGYPDGKQVSPTVTACLEYVPNGWSAFGLLVSALAVIVLSLWLAATTSMLRDRGFPPLGRKSPWSLARFQMALWFVTVVCTILFTYAVTGDISPIPDSVLILMGIGAGTAVSAFAIDAGAVPGSSEDYRALQEQLTILARNVSESQAALDTLKKNGQTDPALDLKLADAQNALAAHRALMKPYEVPASRSFFWDVMSDSNGIAFHRLQVFIWTMTYWLMFVVAAMHKVTLLDFGVTQLALMGISGATYLGFKLQEPAKAPGPGTKAP